MTNLNWFINFLNSIEYGMSDLKCETIVLQNNFNKTTDKFLLKQRKVDLLGYAYEHTIMLENYLTS